MARRKILFVRLGHFSFTNESLLAQLQRSHPGHEIVDFDVKEAIRRRLFEVLIGLAVEAWYYGIRTLFDRADRHGFFFKNPYTFARITALLQREFLAIKDEFDLVVQTQGLFNAALPGVPLVIYTDYTLKSQLFSITEIPESLIAQETALYHRADAIAVTATHARQTLIERYGCLGERIHVIYIGSNISVEAVDTPIERYQAQRICFVGIEWERKGGKFLIEAFLALTDEFPEATLTIVGCSPAVTHPRITATGKIPSGEVKEILRRSSIFCLPSLVEPSSVAVIEAATCGLPVVGTQTGGFFDAVEDGITGYLVPCEDSAALGEALKALLAKPETAREMGLAGRQKALATFNWDVVGEKFAVILDHLVKRGE